MSLLDAIIRTGALPRADASQAEKKRYSELLSAHLAVEVADGLRAVGFPDVRPLREGPGERKFQGGLGPKKVDVSCADEQHGLLLAVSIKSISTPPFGKNLKNRFGDLFSESINLHLRFPYSVICGLFAFPSSADTDVTPGRPISTFRRAMKLLATISGRKEYTGPGEKFENVALMLFEPFSDEASTPWVRLFDAETEREMGEQKYFLMLRDLFNARNPHAAIGAELDVESM
jgi:hypothetical protein